MNQILNLQGVFGVAHEYAVPYVRCMSFLTRLILVLAVLFSMTFKGSAESREEIEKWLQGLQLKPGKTIIESGTVSVDLPDAYRFIDKADAQKILTELWNNPPDKSVLGMIVPKDFSPTAEGSSVVVIQEQPSGYVSDKDASSIDYDQMMKEMKESMPEVNKQREKKGFPSLDLVGWAERPYYDQATHKLYWAKEIKFGDSPVNTLNYNVRILGRKGVLQLNAIGSINQLDAVKQSMPEILKSVNYQEGSRYVDFDPKIDKVAGYGLAALVAGGVAAKAGLFKGLLVGLLAFKKIIIFGLMAVVAYFKKIVVWIRGLFGKK